MRFTPSDTPKVFNFSILPLNITLYPLPFFNLMQLKEWQGLSVLVARLETSDTESAGVPKNIHKDIKHKLKIPMMKKARSLNVTISAAISVSEAMRQIKLLK